MEKQSIEFEIQVEPTGQARAKVTRNGAFKSKKQKTREAQLAELLRPFAPAEPVRGPVWLSIGALMSIPASKPSYGKHWPKGWRDWANIGKNVFPTKTPDIDNIAKQLLDIMNGWFFVDDRQVVMLNVEKRFSDRPRWWVKMSWEDSAENQLLQA